MKNLVEMTNEYAYDLNCMFLTVDCPKKEYYELFSSMFNECLLIDNMRTLRSTSLADIDIIFIKIDNNFEDTKQSIIDDFVYDLRKDNELLSIYMIDCNHIDRFYSLDGNVPTPFDKDKIYKFLYRVLQRIVAKKELFKYISILEEQLNITSNTNNIILPVVPSINRFDGKSKVLTSERHDDIRHSHTHKIPAVDFVKSIDDAVFEKVDSVKEELGYLVDTIHSIDSVNNSQQALELIADANVIIQDIFFLIDSMTQFEIMARAFDTLKMFLDNMEQEQLEDVEKKNLFADMLFSVIEDLEKWIIVIFYDQNTNDINYLDSSFASNILDIENIFNEDAEDESELEFF